jgi:hypothetical protein
VAGIIGLSGSIASGFDGLPSHPLSKTGGVGVYGHGADMTTTMVPPVDANGDPIPGGRPVQSGPAETSTGVMGRGGVFSPERGSVPSAVGPPPGAGVVGLAGGVDIPTGKVTSGTGVFGQGLVGVRGTGTTNGGVFESAVSAQLRLIPHDLKLPRPPSRASSPMELIGGLPDALPKSGLSGDLIAINQPVAADEPTLLTCTLWLCVRGEVKNDPAVWGASPSWTNGRWASITRPTKPPGPVGEQMKFG